MAIRLGRQCRLTTGGSASCRAVVLLMRTSARMSGTALQSDAYGLCLIPLAPHVPSRPTACRGGAHHPDWKIGRSGKHEAVMVYLGCRLINSKKKSNHNQPSNRKH